MKITALTSLFVLLSVVSMVAIAPSAFADHTSATVTNALGSSTPGCEDTNSCFDPNPVTIAMGGTVTWENVDNAAHTVTSGSPADGPDGVFDSSLIMAGGATFSHTFDDVGTYDYFCMVHPWMQGSVIVEDEAAAEAEAAEAEAAEAEAAEAEAAAAAAIAALEAEQAAEAAAAEAAAAESLAALEAAAAESLAALEAEQAAEAEAAAVVMAAPREPAIDLVDTLSYNISGGSVSSIITNSDDATLVVAVDASDDGELSITMDSNYITAFDDDSYFVLVNNEEVWFSQDGNTLTIPFEAGTEKIEIVGSAVVPEFGTIAMVVLAVAIISIIVITAKTKTQLIPKL
jgi:predicted secreted protein with PEFG-CTERM motif